MNQKGLTPITIFLIIGAAFLGGYYIYSNTPQMSTSQDISTSLVSKNTKKPIEKQIPSVKDTKEWRTYISPAKDYSFSYPKGLVITIGDPRDHYVEVLCRGDQCDASYNINNFSVIETTYKSLDEVVKNEFVTDYEKVKFQGLDVVKTLTPDLNGIAGGWQGSIISMYVEYKEKIYKIDLNYPNIYKDKFVDYPEPLPDILSTFKFTN